MTMWRIRIAGWIPKAKNTRSEYVIRIAFPLQQWFKERASVLQVQCYKYSVTSTVLQVQCYRYSVTGTVLQVQCYRYSVTSTMLQVQCPTL